MIPRSTVVFILLQGFCSKTSPGPPSAGFWSTFLFYTISSLWPQGCANPSPRRATVVLIFHVGLITQFYDYGNVLQIATRQLIQGTWIPGQLAVVLESFNHHVISHLFKPNTRAHTHTHTNVICGLSFVCKFSVCSEHPCSVSAFPLGCPAPSLPRQPRPHCHDNSGYCWESHDLHSLNWNTVVLTSSYITEWVLWHMYLWREASNGKS